MSRKRHQFLKCQNLPCNLGQALVLNETVEGAGSKFRAEREGEGRASSMLAASFKALVSTSHIHGEHRQPALPVPRRKTSVPPQPCCASTLAGCLGDGVGGLSTATPLLWACSYGLTKGFAFPTLCLVLFSRLDVHSPSPCTCCTSNTHDYHPQVPKPSTSEPPKPLQAL